MADPAERIADLDDERTHALRRALTRMPATDAALLGMTACEGFSLREAAAVLGLGESAAKMRLSRLRARLRAEIPARRIVEGGA